MRNFYWHVIRGSTLAKLWFCVRYYLFRQWAMNIAFSNQDLRVVGGQDYRAQERLTWTDGVVVGWSSKAIT